MDSMGCSTLCLTSLSCNPPYVDSEDMANLPPEYQKEPEVALKSGEDGLELVRRLLNQASDWLSAEGVMILEVRQHLGPIRSRSHRPHR